MMMHMKKRIGSLLIIFVLHMCFTTSSLATSILIDVDPGLPSNQDNANKLVGNFTGLLSGIGYVISVGMLVFIGIKYLLASADERASLKGMLPKVVIGSLIIACASTLVIFFNSILTVAA